MNRLDVGIGEYKVSNSDSDVIKTYALGSCVAVIVYDQANKVGGMIHIALPESVVNKEKAEKLPGYFADTGLPVFLNKMLAMGADKRKMKIKMAGGAKILDDKGTFDIGRRNVLAIKKILWRYGLGPTAEDVGKSISRTVTLKIDTGEVILNNAKNTWTL